MICQIKVRQGLIKVVDNCLSSWKDNKSVINSDLSEILLHLLLGNKLVIDKCDEARLDSTVQFPLQVHHSKELAERSHVHFPNLCILNATTDNL